MAMTETWTVPPPDAPAKAALGGITWSDVAVTDVGVADALPNLTEVAPVKFVPVMVMTALGSNGIWLADMPAMMGGPE
jgi:hypothetical protein